MTTGGEADIFISYKREDEARVGRLVRALEGAGLSVWWDRGLPGGEDWRAGIEAALDAAKVVLVCWTHASTGPEGGFVRDEAARAKGRLVPVILERGVRPPLGFGEVQAIDLSHWNGNARDSFFQDLIALLIAKRDGAPPPRPKGPTARALRRFVYGGGLTAFILGAIAFAWSTPLVRETSCALPVPGLARACCLAGFTEKVGARDTAWTPAAHQLAGYLRNAPRRSGARGFATEAQAQADAEHRLPADARQVCAVSEPESQRLVGAEARITRFQCAQPDGDWDCAADYVATCRIEERRMVARCPK